jgi:hypothetical protein
MWIRSRRLTAAVAAGYVLALATAALVHNHAGYDVPSGGCCGSHRLADNHAADDSHSSHENGCPAPAAPDRRPAQDSNCAACQFLAQKPAMLTVVAPTASAAMVEDVAVASASRANVGVFSAWQSRAPPAFA